MYKSLSTIIREMKNITVKDKQKEREDETLEQEHHRKLEVQRKIIDNP